MTEVKKKKVIKKEYVALKCLCTSEGQVKKGESFTCSEKELATFKKHKAV
jgi:hypothetical protein